MRILLIIPEKFRGNRWGGVTTYVLELASELKRVGHDVIVGTPGVSSQQIFYQGIPIHYIYTQQSKNRAVRFVMRLLHQIIPSVINRLEWASAVLHFVRKQSRLDIVEAPEWGASTLLLHGLRMPTVVVMLHRSWMHYKRDNQLPIYLEDRGVHLLEKVSILLASAVLSPTDFMMTQYPLIRFVHRHLRIPWEKAHYGLSKERRVIRPRVLPRRPFLLVSGRIEVAKGSATVLQAFKRIALRHPTLRLYFVGEDTRMFIGNRWVSWKGYIQQSFVSDDIKSRVIFLPRRDRAVLAWYIKQCAVCVVPSRGCENQPLVMLEAMKYGAPLVVSNAGGITETVVDGINGCVFAQDDSASCAQMLERMISNPRLRFRISSTNRRCFPTIEDQGKRVVRIYRMVLDGHSKNT